MLNNSNNGSGSTTPNQGTDESSSTSTSPPSIFSKLELFFSDTEVIPVPPNTSTSDHLISQISSSPITPAPSLIPCLCFNCFGTVESKKTWRSIDEEKLKRELRGMITGRAEDVKMERVQPCSLATVSSIPPTAISPSSSSTVPSSFLSTEVFQTYTVATGTNTVSPCSLDYCNCQKKKEEDEMENENELLRKKVQLQYEVIQKLVQIGNISNQLMKMDKGKKKID